MQKLHIVDIAMEKKARKKKIWTKNTIETSENIAKGYSWGRVLYNKAVFAKTYIDPTSSPWLVIPPIALIS